MKSTGAPITFASSVSCDAAGPSPATRSGMSASAAASIAVSTPFSGASRPATSAYSPSAARLARRTHRRAGSAGPRRSGRPARPAAPIGRRRTRSAPTKRSTFSNTAGWWRASAAAYTAASGTELAAVEEQARQRVAVVAAEARAAVARGDPDRAEEAQVVEVHDDRRPGGARALEGARAEQRQRVVDVDDVGAQLARGRASPRARRGRRGAARARRPGATRPLELRSRRACSTPARSSAASCSSTERSSPPSRR